MDELEKKTAELTDSLDLLTQSYDDTLEALGSALDLKDAETEGHSQRVTCPYRKCYPARMPLKSATLRG